MTNEEKQEKINELQAKYTKLRELALKIGAEMDSLLDQYNQLNNEEVDG
jgi:hypothetical protein